MGLLMGAFFDRRGSSIGKRGFGRSYGGSLRMASLPRVGRALCLTGGTFYELDIKQFIRGALCRDPFDVTT